jgi:PAS domain S-box-containing protein
MNEAPINSPSSSPAAGYGPARSARPLARPAVAWVVLALCLLATAIACQVSLHQMNRRGYDRFRLHMEQVIRAIQSRMEGCEQVLKGAEGLFIASRSVERLEWHDYVAGLDINQRYPGIRALGFIAVVPPSEVEAFTARNRQDGAPDFTLTATNASPPQSPYYVIEYVEPMRGNASSLGFNAASDPRQREAADQARDLGEAVLTGKVQLRQSDEALPAVLLLAPIYRHDAPRATVPERRAAIIGWVYAAFVMKDLMAGLMESPAPEIDFEIFDGTRISRLNLLYDADGDLHALDPRQSKYHATLTPLVLAHRTWSMHFSTRPAFDAATDYTEVRLLVFAGVCVSLLLFGIVRSLASTQQRALVLAQEMTEKFRIQERAVISSSNGIFITDVSARGHPIIYANPAMERITGYSAEELTGQDPRFLMREDYAQPDLAKLQNALAAGEECRVVLRSYRKDGSLFWNELNVSPVRDEHGIVNHFVGITEDITDRKRAEETLRSTNALQRAILDSAGYAVISTSPTGLIRIFNAAAERMTGYKADEVIGRPTSLLIHDWGEVEQRARELSAELGRPIHPDFEVFVAKARLGQADEHEWTYVRKDGNRLPVLLTVTPVRDERGVILGFMGIASDITERKRSQAQLQQATLAAESASRTKGEFLANMSHEIRTPINAVIGMTELALGTALTREQRGYLTAVEHSARDLLTVINDVLDFSKIEAGKLELHPEAFHLRDALNLSLKTFSLRAAEKALELSLRVHPDVPNALVGDLGRLRQIINNLVSNALKFTGQGEVSVEVALAGGPVLDESVIRKSVFSDQLRTPTPLRPPNTASLNTDLLIHFQVRDTGIGVPEDKQAAIFEAFTQADASVTRKYGGTGLGLTIAAKLCRLMGGDIWVKSEPARGSVFHFTARFGVSPTTADAAAPPPAPALAGQRVLVVDDNATSRFILCEMLANWRLTPVAAASAAEARAAMRDATARGDSFRFALLDALMPGEDGFSLARELQRAPATAPAIVMLLSSAGRPEEIDRCRETGVERYLVKPIGQSELLDALQPPLVETRTPAVVQPLMDLPPPRGTTLRVLLAEDNPVNRELAMTVLQKLGHAVVTVGNGREVLHSWQRGRFDLILMDVQMPLVDGLEATGQIRRQEQKTGGHVPIIGLTAHAMKGDREKGLAAGMDEYLTKPLQLQDLARAIEKWKPKNGGPAPASPRFDPEALLKALDGDQAAVRRLVALFLESTPPLLANIRRALAPPDAPALCRAAHTLHGSLTHLKEEPARRTVAELEQTARAGNLDPAPALVAQLDRQLDGFQGALREWLEGST